MLLKNLHSPADGKQYAAHLLNAALHWHEAVEQYLLQQKIRLQQFARYGKPYTSNEIYDRQYCFANRIAFGSDHFAASLLSLKDDVPGFVACFPCLTCCLFSRKTNAGNGVYKYVVSRGDTLKG